MLRLHLFCDGRLTCNKRDSLQVGWRTLLEGERDRLWNIISAANHPKGLEQLTELSPPPHVSLYDWPAVTAAGIMVNAIGALWARAATTMDAPTKRALAKCMFVCNSVLPS